MSNRTFYGYIIYEPIFTGTIWRDDDSYETEIEAKNAGLKALESFQGWSNSMILVICRHELIEYDILKELLSKERECDSMDEEQFAEYSQKYLYDPTSFREESYRESRTYYTYYMEFHNNIKKSYDKYSNYDYAYHNAFIHINNEATKCFIRKHLVTVIH